MQVTIAQALRRLLRAGVLAGAGCSTSQGPPPFPPPVGHYVTPSGSGSGDGTAARPWDLVTGLAGASGQVQPGDTVWLRAGTYPGVFTSTLTGAASAPIIVRQYPGERATIDGHLRVEGANVWFWGLEVMQSDPLGNASLPGDVEVYASGSRLINMVIHDAGRQGINHRTTDGYAEVSGCIVYNNGTHEDLDHGIYAPSDNAVKWIKDNVFFNNLGFGIHVFATTNHPRLTNVHVVGNVSFNNGTISVNGPRHSNLLIGADTTTESSSAIDNLLYFSGTAGNNLRLGFAGRDNRDIVAQGNYGAGGESGLQVGDWRTASIGSNTFLGLGEMVDLGAPSVGGYQWTGNTFVRDPAAMAWRFEGTLYNFATWKRLTGLGATDQAGVAAPTAPKVVVRPNAYEPGRANIVVYNWGAQSSIAVNVLGLLTAGDAYEVRNVQDFYGAPVTQGTYSGGGTIAIPMGGVPAPLPIGRTTPTPPQTGPRFDVFVLLRPAAP